MDISSLACSMSQTNLMTNVGFAMLSKSLDNVESIGDDMRKMMEQSVIPSLGQNIDISI